jgi:hypothetical protein
VRSADGFLFGVQGLAIARQCGATKAQFDATVNNRPAHNFSAYEDLYFSFQEGHAQKFHV